jgi:hypothetical protein
MTVELSWSIRLTPPEPVAASTDKTTEPGVPGPARFSRLRPIGRRLWTFLVDAISGPADHGIDDSAFPSGYAMPHGRGSRAVRNLWHQPF